MQIPLILSDDAHAVVSRVKHVWQNQRLYISELQTSWRPPGGRFKKLWSDQRLFKAIDEAITSGHVKQVEGVRGTLLEFVQ